MSLNRSYIVTIETLDTHEISPQDPRTSLLNTDLFCTADGPDGSSRCENTRVENYTDTFGFKGYKVFRKRIITRTRGTLDNQTYDDVVYVYLLPEVKKGPGLLTYAAVMFSVDTPSQTNLKELTTIAETFFTF